MTQKTQTLPTVTEELDYPKKVMKTVAYFNNSGLHFRLPTFTSGTICLTLNVVLDPVNILTSKIVSNYPHKIQCERVRN